MVLKTLKPLKLGKQRAVVAIPPKRVDPFYLSPAWKELREQVLARDGYVCVVPGCGKRAVVADHIVSRRWGGRDELGNLCSLCDEHDHAYKEGPTGKRPKEWVEWMKSLIAVGG